MLPTAPAHRRGALVGDAVPASTLRAVGVLQRALHAVVRAFDAERPGLVVGLLEGWGSPGSAGAWSEALHRQLEGLPDDAPAFALVVAAQRRNAALDDLRDLLDPAGLDDALDALMGRALDVEPGPPGGVTLGDALLAPCRAHPDDLWAQVAFVARTWGALLPEDVRADLLRAQDVRAEETQFRGWGPGPVEVFTPPPPGSFPVGDDASVRFSEDHDWMKRLVMIAKHTAVWLDQLSRRYGREIAHLDQIPDEELQRLADAGFTGIWLIGIWERSVASREIKQRMGNPDALASAYAVWDYEVAGRLGGPAAADRLRERALRFGIRVGADMVPNHTALDGRWVFEHPERFIQLSEPPFPNYTFGGPDLSRDSRYGLFLEDGYWDKSDAAVVFKLVEHHTGQTRFLYHGNDGTVMPWNDTAQLDFTRADTREAVIQALLGVAKRFPILRLDAAMTLARKHVQRLWFPPPGQGGAIPSRADHGLSSEQFLAAMPREFWVEVVERVAAEAPDTLLLAEAFWMMEEYFVRSLGMHRVYHSAFMHMLRDGDNAGFRRILGDMLRYSPAVLERYANFLSNPDEETAAQQFGTMDRYFTATTLLATLPGLPMFGHGQLEGSREKYGMEAARANHDEQLDEGLFEHHRRVVFPLLRERLRFSSTERFHLFDHVRPDGGVNEDVYAFTNLSAHGQRTLVLVNHGPDRVVGRIHHSRERNEGSIEAPELVSRTLSEALDLAPRPNGVVLVHEQRDDVWRLLPAEDLAAGGLGFDLGPWETRVFDRLDQTADADGRWLAMARQLGGRPQATLPDPESTPGGLPMREVDPKRAAPGGLPPATPPRGAGVLLHPSSLPGPEGIGTIGQSARDFVRWVEDAGLRYWQVLPLCEGGPGESPYSSPASFVGNPWLIDLMDLHAAGLIDGGQLAAGLSPADGDVDFDAVKAKKGPVLRAAARALLDRPDHPLHGEWLVWRAANPWIDDAALFGEIRDAQGGEPWWTWPAPLRDREAGALEAARAQHAAGVDERAVLAFLFDHQWARLVEHAARHGVLLVGDLPIYVSRDSADAWAERERFEFGPDGQPARVAGVPPDAFAATGQLWGNPLYDWDAMAADGYAWWVRRLERCLGWTPVLRIDHFRGFAAYWAVPAEAETAMAGQWVPGPDLALFRALREALGGQWLIAEDLGEIDEPVHVLRKKAGLLCTRVLQFGFGSGSDNLHLPANIAADTVMYTGTHDNDTLMGWWATARPEEKRHCLSVVGPGPAPLHARMVKTALGSVAELVVVPIQDLLGYGAEARMNTPGTASGNWAWRLRPGALGRPLAEEVRGWVAESGRLR